MRLEHDVFRTAIARLGERRDDVVVLSGDLGDSCELDLFRQRFPKRYFDMGLSEQNMVSWAAGLALEGLLPIVCTFGPFLYRRALDQVEMSVASMGLPVVLVGFVPGITTPRGISHQATNDVAVMRSVPGMAIYDVGDATEVAGALDAACERGGPAYIRMLRGNVPTFLPSDHPYEDGRMVALGPDGSPEPEPCAEPDIVLLSSSVCTAEALRATRAMTSRGVRLAHVHVPAMRPIDADALSAFAGSARMGVITYENHLVEGGLGTIMAEAMAERGIARPLVRLGIPVRYLTSGSPGYLMRTFGLDAMALVSAVEGMLGRSLDMTEDMLEPGIF